MLSVITKCYICSNWKIVVFSVSTSTYKVLIRNYTALQNLSVWVWRKGQGQLLHQQARKNPEGLGFDLGATYNLGRWHRIPFHTSSGDFPQLVPAYSIHTVTTQCGSGNYLVEALNVLILCAHLCCEHLSLLAQKEGTYKELHSFAEPQCLSMTKGQGQLLHEQARKNPEGLGFGPGATSVIFPLSCQPGLQMLFVSLVIFALLILHGMVDYTVIIMRISNLHCKFSMVWLTIQLLLWESVIFTVNSPWYGCPYKPYLENQ